MSYCIESDIRKQIFEDELIRLTDETGMGTIDTGKLDTAIETADVEIDAYLGEKYSLPLAEPPAILTKLSVDLSIRNLYQLNPGGVPEHREKQAANAIRMLEQIAKGLLTLGVGDPQTGSSDNAVLISSPGRLFSRDKLKGF